MLDAVRCTPRPLAMAMAVALLVMPTPRGARAAQAPEPASAGVRVIDFPDKVARTKRDVVMREARNERRERIERAAAYRRLMKQKAQGKKGVRVKPVAPDAEGVLPEDRTGPPVRVQLPAGVSSLNAIPVNAPINNPSGDAASDTQAEEGIAMLGNNGVCAWNDGHNFSSAVDAQQAAYTNNGGATWTDIGPPPKPVGGRWASDPVVTVNEKTGTFTYCGLIDFSSTSQNGIAMVPGSFSGGVFSWGTPRTVRSGPNANIGFDKQWMVADSVSGNLYISYTTFGVADTIIYQRSTDGGVNWGNPIIMNTDPNSYGYVQGSRPCVGPSGEVYVIWSQGGLVDVDYMKLRKSTDGGVSFGGEILVGSEYTNYGTGGPGFNRDHGVVFPAIAVDRSTGPHRGRVYATWNETIDWYDDPLGSLGNQAEVESNNTAGTANAFVIGKNLTGTISSTADLDYFSFTATAGTTYIFWSDLPSGSSLKYTLRIFCTDGTTRLANGGDNATGGFDGFSVWTAPAAGTYYVRMGGLAGGGTGAYTLRTGVDGPSGSDRARDARDAIVAWSDGGTSWTHYVRPNDDAALYDEYLSEVGVSCEGYVYSLWYDYRDSPPANCAGVANIELSRSTDGGVSWAANQRVTSTATNFTTALTNLQPNMGDYNGITGGANIGMAWADGRAGSVDAWGATLVAAPGVVCPSPPTVSAGSSFNMTFTIQNQNVMFSNDYSTTITSDQPTWTITPPSQNASVGPSLSGNVVYQVTVPANSPSVVGNLCFQVTAQGGALCGTCCVPVTVNGVAGVPPGTGPTFALEGAQPNPAAGSSGFTVSFSLPGDAPATLELLDLSGRRLLSREVGSLGGGRHTISWQRESAELPAGMYILRLSQSGRTASSKVVRVK